MVATTRGANSPRKLKFTDKIVTKGLTTDALVKKMKARRAHSALHAELSSIDQDNVDTNTLQGVRKELISTSILLHKDKGDIFQFFFRQLSTGLRGPEAPYYNEYFYLLESLASIKSIVLVCDIPAADELLSTIFRNIFDLVAISLPKNVEMFMSEILIALIDECATVPQEVLETILAQFIPTNGQSDTPGYRLSVGVCTQTSDKLQRHVAQYFSDILLQHSSGDQSSIDTEDMDELHQAHKLVQRLAHAVPSILLNVIPQLEEELRVTDQSIRSIATQTLGAIFGDPNGASLAKKYPATWGHWLARKNDRVAAVRVMFVEATKGILIHHAELRSDMEEALRGKFMDPDDKVRAAVCKVFSQLDYEAALHHVTKAQLEDLAGRCLDRKQAVRTEAFNSIGRLYSLAYPEIENNDLGAIPQFSWIPEKLLEASAMAESREEAEKCISQYVLPLPAKGEDVVAWTERLLLVMKYLSGGFIAKLLTLTNLKAQRPTLHERFVQCCVDYNGGVVDKNEEEIKRHLDAAIMLLTAMIPESTKQREDLHTFAKLNESRLYKLLRTCMDPQTDLKTLIKTTSEFHRRVEQSSAGILETMSWFLRRASLHIVNQSSVPTLVKKLRLADTPNSESQAVAGEVEGVQQTHAEIIADRAQDLLECISKYHPAVYKPHVGELIKALADEKHPKLMQYCAQALAAVVRLDGSLAPTEKRTIDRLVRIALGDGRKPAKFALRALAHCKDGKVHCGKVVNAVTAALNNAQGDALVAHVAVLAEAAKSCPEAFEDKSDVTTTFLVQGLLMDNTSSTSDAMVTEDNDEEWAEDSQLNATGKAKILALKVMHNRCLAHAESDAAMDISAPVFKLLFSILDNGGSVNPSVEYDPMIKARLRLQAAVSLLKLSSIEIYANVVLKNLIMLAITFQDTSFRVRSELLNKFVNMAVNRKLDPNFFVLAFITAHDPEKEIRDRARNWVTVQMRRLPVEVRVQQFDMLFIRLLHLLAHHPDFSETGEGLQDMAKYIEFYLDIIATAENVSLQFHLALKAKSVRDSESHVFSELSLSLDGVLRVVTASAGTASNRQWTLNTYPGKVKIPADIFRPLPNPEAASTISKKEYLREENLQWLSTAGKPHRSPNSKVMPIFDQSYGSRRAADDVNGKDKDKPARKRKAAASGRTNGTSKKPRRPKKANTWREQSDDDESDGEATSESDEDLNTRGQSKGRAGQAQARSREERLARRSRGGEDKKENTDGEDAGGDEQSEQEAEDDSNKEDTPKAKAPTRTQRSARSRKSK
ncbi:sister chromatid cohesion protein [Ceratobasidium sp. AG-Ba]|nr:sister chromatid cohesion protein [Ceratobasidium sp. AG-Ba]